MSQILDTTTPRPTLGPRLLAHTAIAAARLLAHLRPRHLCAVLRMVRTGATPATHTQALQARQHITATSTFCAGRYCLQRSLATALLCRIRGHWPTWCTGVRTPPFAAHAWIEAEGHPIGEPPHTTTYHPILTIPPHRTNHPLTGTPSPATPP
jgi:Transglutaminase-like superfamily